MLSRLATYVACDKELKLGPQWLARNGYFYEPKTDLVKCGNCSHTIEDAKISSDILISEHKRWSPTCSFSKSSTCPEEPSTALRDLVHGLNLNKDGNDSSCSASIGECEDDEIFNILDKINVDKVYPSGTKPAVKQMLKSIKERHGRNNKTINKGLKADGEGLRRTAGNVNPYDDTDFGRDSGATNIPKARPSHPHLNWDDLFRGAKHPGLASAESRRETFRGQEYKYEHLTVPIERFVDAGLYYKGPLDNVRCFYCDGGLKNFKAQDDPWTEHSRWFADCKFVVFKENQLQGDAVDGQPVLQVDNICRPHISRSSGSADIRPNCSRPVVPPILNPVRVLEAREIKARLETPMIQRLLNMGYKRDHIKRSLERRFGLVGDDYTSIGEMVDDILKCEGDFGVPKSSISASSARSYDSVQSSQSSSSVSQLNVNTNSSAGLPISSNKAGDHDNVDGTVDASKRTQSFTPNGIATGKSNNQRTLESNDGRIEAEYEKSGASLLKAHDVTATLKHKDVQDEELKKLWREYESLAQIKTCKVCLDKDINTVFLPCGHFVCCDVCTPQLTYCCICRTIIRGTVRVLETE